MHAHRSPLALAAIVARTIGVAACSSDDSAVSIRRSNSSTIAHSSDPEVALIRIGSVSSAPGMVIGGDGWVYEQTAAPDGIASAPSGLIQNMGNISPVAVPLPPAPTPFTRRKLTDEGIQIVLDLADDKGLLQHQSYESPGVTDMGSTSMSATVSDGTFEHSAYALSYEHESGNRKDLWDFLTEIDDIEALVGHENIGPAEPYVPGSYFVTINGSYYTDGADVDWPSDVPVTEGCVQLPIAKFHDGVAGVYVADIDGTDTRVAVIPDLPGDGCTG